MVVKGPSEPFALCQGASAKLAAPSHSDNSGDSFWPEQECIQAGDLNPSLLASRARSQRKAMEGDAKWGHSAWNSLPLLSVS